MTKVLVVDACDSSRDAIGSVLLVAACQVVSAPSGSMAVGMLQSECPDVIVSSANLGDMDAYQFFADVRRDRTTMDTPFLLLAGRNRPVALAAAEAGADLVLTGAVALDVVVTRVLELADAARAGSERAIRRIESPRTARVAIPLWEALPDRAAGVSASDGAGFHGSLQVMDLAEVTQAIALGGKTGCLSVGFSTGKGSMLFEAGRLVHAQFLDKSGEAAFAALVRASQREKQAPFRFEQIDRVQESGPRTIARAVDQLLLSIAAGIDEDGAAAAPAQ